MLVTVDRPARDPVCALLHEQGRSDPALFLVLLAFMGAMLGIIVSGNVILLSIFWELTSIFSFLLISYWHTSAAARDGARMALTITGIGGFCLLIGMLLLGKIVGSYDLDKILASGQIIREHPLYLPTSSSSCSVH